MSDFDQSQAERRHRLAELKYRNAVQIAFLSASDTTYSQPITQS